MSYITKRIKLLNLPSDVLEAIMNRRLDTTVAEELLSVKGGIKQSELASLTANRRLSLRITRKLLKEVNDNERDLNLFNESDYIDYIK